MPEEINRLVADQLSDLLFCPTRRAVEALAKEGRDVRTGVRFVGDVRYDAFPLFRPSALARRLPGDLDALSRQPFALMTCHRAENTDNAGRLAAIIEGVSRISSRLPFLFPVHPRTRAALARCSAPLGERVHVVEPVSYLDMLLLLLRTRIVLTDSGGLQKEAFFAGKPCVTFRDETEWTELVSAGWNILTGANADLIFRAAGRFLDFDQLPAAPEALFGDGAAAERIVGSILEVDGAPG